MRMPGSAWPTRRLSVCGLDRLALWVDGRQCGSNPAKPSRHSTSCLPVICPQSEARARYTALTPSADQVLLLPRGYSFFNSAVQFSTTVTGSVDVVAVSIRNRLPSGATSQPKTCEATALWAI